MPHLMEIIIFISTWIQAHNLAPTNILILSSNQSLYCITIM